MLNQILPPRSLSDSCQSALSGIVTNADTANCLNPSALISIALNGGNTSVIQPIDTWLTGLCAQAPCTNATLEATTRSILSGCSTDLGSFGLNVNDDSTASSVVATVQQYYPTVRKVVCLKEYVHKRPTIRATLMPRIVRTSCASLRH